MTTTGTTDPFLAFSLVHNQRAVNSDQVSGWTESQDFGNSGVTSANIRVWKGELKWRRNTLGQVSLHKNTLKESAKSSCC